MDASDLVGFGVSGVNYIAQLGQSEHAFAQNKALARLQNQMNIEQWQRENAYNHPMQQMLRYKQAGLNPNLMVGEQNLSANSPQLVGGTPYQSPQANPIDAQGVAQLSLIDAQKRLIDAQINDLNKSAGLKGKEAENIDFQQYQDQKRLELEKKLADSNVEVNKAEIDNLNESTKKLSEEIQNIGVERAIANLNKEFLEKSMDDRLEMVSSELKKLNAEIKLTDAQTYRITTLVTQELRNLEASFDEIQARTDLTKEQRYNLMQQKEIDMMDNIYLLAAEEEFKQGHKVRGNFGLICNRLLHSLIIGHK